MNAAFAVGYALGEAVMFFPITYLAMKGSKFQFRGGLSQAWRPFSFCVIALALLHIMAQAIGWNTQSEASLLPQLMLTIVVPIVINAVILFATYRRETPPTE
jgi:ABC-type transport system involved in cytochrome c biogenesis permease component